MARTEYRNRWHYTTQGNGAFVTIHAPDGRTAFLQGDDAAAFMERAAKTNEHYTDADLCEEYESIVQPPMTETIKTWDVFRTENRANGRTDHAGTVDAVDADEALREAQARFEYDAVHHLFAKMLENA